MRQINTFAEGILSADDPHDVALELMGALIDFVAGPWIISMVEYAAEELDKRHKTEPWSA